MGTATRQGFCQLSLSYRALRRPGHPSPLVPRVRGAWFRIMLLYRLAAARQELSPILVVRRFMHWSTGVLHGVVLLVLQLCTSTAALAQLAPAPAVDRCGGQARKVARFAAQAYRWSVVLPVVVPVGKLAKGVIFRATANPACCELTSACGASSEVADALVGNVDERLFALTKNPPDWWRMPLKPWRADKWSEFLAAAGAGPRDAKEALELVWLVLSSIRPRLGRLDDGAALATLVAAQRSHELLLVLPAMQQAGAAPVLSTALPRAAGYDVTLWASHYATNKALLRDIGAGASSDEALLRVRARIGYTAEVTIYPPEPISQILTAPQPHPTLIQPVSTPIKPGGQ